MVRRAPRLDANQQAIVEALRTIPDVSCYSLAGVANGIPDLLVGVHQQTYLVEVKDGEKAPSAQTLTPDQVRFIGNWTGSPVVVLTSVDTAISWVSRL